MSSTPTISRAALAAGIPARYLYWTGRSGRRYLFTRMEGGAAVELESGVAIAVQADDILWIGEVGDLPAEHPRMRGAAIYVHLLAATLAERRGVIWDLRPADTTSHLRLAA